MATSYPEGMTIDVTFSPTTQTFYASALLRNGEDELFGFQSAKASEALEELAAELRDRYER